MGGMWGWGRPLTKPDLCIQNQPGHSGPQRAGRGRWGRWGRGACAPGKRPRSEGRGQSRGLGRGGAAGSQCRTPTRPGAGVAAWDARLVQGAPPRPPDAAARGARVRPAQVGRGLRPSADLAGDPARPGPARPGPARWGHARQGRGRARGSHRPRPGARAGALGSPSLGAAAAVLPPCGRRPHCASGPAALPRVLPGVCPAPDPRGPQVFLPAPRPQGSRQAGRAPGPMSGPCGLCWLQRGAGWEAAVSRAPMPGSQGRPGAEEVAGTPWRLLASAARRRTPQTRVWKSDPFRVLSRQLAMVCCSPRGPMGRGGPGAATSK